MKKANETTISKSLYKVEQVITKTLIDHSKKVHALNETINTLNNLKDFLDPIVKSNSNQVAIQTGMTVAQARTRKQLAQNLLDILKNK